MCIINLHKRNDLSKQVQKSLILSSIHVPMPIPIPIPISISISISQLKQLDQSTLCDEDDFMCQFQQMWQAPFMPNLLNSVVFLVETSQMISVFFANYKGRCSGVA